MLRADELLDYIGRAGIIAVHIEEGEHRFRFTPDAEEKIEALLSEKLSHTCKNCIHYDANAGSCHIDPPAPERGWPLVTEDCWCSSFEGDF